MGRGHLGGSFDDSVTPFSTESRQQMRNFAGLRARARQTSRARTRANGVEDNASDGDAEISERIVQADGLGPRQRGRARDDHEPRV
jgi:hypothetical protein